MEKDRKNKEEREAKKKASGEAAQEQKDLSAREAIDILFATAAADEGAFAIEGEDGSELDELPLGLDKLELPMAATPDVESRVFAALYDMDDDEAASGLDDLDI